MGFEVFAVCSRHVPSSTSIRIILLVSDHCIQTLSKHHTCHYSALRGKISHSSACLSTNWKSAGNFKHIYIRRNLLQLLSLYYIKVLLLLFFYEFPPPPPTNNLGLNFKGTVNYIIFPKSAILYAQQHTSGFVTWVHSCK